MAQAADPWREAEAAWIGTDAMMTCNGMASNRGEGRRCHDAAADKYLQAAIADKVNPSCRSGRRPWQRHDSQRLEQLISRALAVGRKPAEAGGSS